MLQIFDLIFDFAGCFLFPNVVYKQKTAETYWQQKQKC